MRAMNRFEEEKDKASTFNRIFCFVIENGTNRSYYRYIVQ